MAQSPDPMQRHRLRVELRDARQRASMTQREAAARLVWSESKVLRIEAGQTGVSLTDLKALMDLYKINDRQVRKRLTDLATGSRRQLWSSYRDVLKPEFMVYLSTEAAATRIWHFEPLLVPGLLQTREYATAVLEALAPAGSTVQDRQRQLEARMKRQDLLERPKPPRMHFVLDEAVIRRSVNRHPDGPLLMRRQLEHLRQVARRRTVTVQILPFDRGLHSGLKGSFILLELPDREGELLYVEHSRGNSALRADPKDIAPFRRSFDELVELAAPAGDLDTFLDTAVRAAAA